MVVRVLQWEIRGGIVLNTLWVKIRWFMTRGNDNHHHYHYHHVQALTWTGSNGSGGQLTLQILLPVGSVLLPANYTEELLLLCFCSEPESVQCVLLF